MYAEALGRDPKLAEDRQTQHAYNAACAAALASTGKGNDAAALDNDAKAKLRSQAHDWLEAELAIWRRISESGDVSSKSKIAPKLQHWKVDADLAGIREAKELAKLPETERAEFENLWREFDALLSKTMK